MIPVLSSEYRHRKAKRRDDYSHKISAKVSDENRFSSELKISELEEAKVANDQLNELNKALQRDLAYLATDFKQVTSWVCSATLEFDYRLGLG